VSVVPADHDRPPTTGQRQGRRFRLDRPARLARESAPGPDRHLLLHAPPCPHELALDEEAARPHARAPERATAVGVRDQELPIATLEEKVGVSAREHPNQLEGLSKRSETRFREHYAW
jgi:hypothetical protein